MEYSIAILMFCMAGGLLLYAGLLALVKDPMLIPKHWAANMKNKKEYCLMIAKVVALTAIPFAASGFTGLIWNAEETLLPAIIVLVIGFVVCIWLSRKIVRKVY